VQACGPDQVLDVILAGSGEEGLTGVASLLVSFVRGDQGVGRALQKEGCWAVSNIAAGADRHRGALAQAGMIPALITCLQSAPFEARREAAFGERSAPHNLLAVRSLRESVLQSPSKTCRLQCIYRSFQSPQHMSQYFLCHTHHLSFVVLPVCRSVAFCGG
jgi:hypothetical protein